MFSGQTRTGVHISERKIQYIELLIENAGVQIVDIGEFNFNENIDFSKIKETIVQEILVAALDSKLFANRKYSTIVSFALPLNVFKFFTSYNCSQFDFKEHLAFHRWEMQLLYPKIDFSDLIFSFANVQDTILFGKNRKIVAAGNRNLFHFLTTLCKKNKMRIGAFDFAHFAFDKAVKYLNYGFADGISATIYYNDKSVSIELFLNGDTIFHKVIPRPLDTDEFLFDPKILDNELKVASGLVRRLFVCRESDPDKDLKILASDNLEIIDLKLTDEIVISEDNSRILRRSDINYILPACGIVLRQP